MSGNSGQEPRRKRAPGSTEHLAARARAGDRAELARLYGKVVPAIHAYASLRVPPRWLDPGDVVAEVWWRALRRLASYDDRRPFRAWIFGFARNVVHEFQRTIARGAASVRRSGQWSDDLPDEVTSVTRRLARDESMDRFVEWVREQLSDYEREVLILRGLQGRALSEVASALGRTVRAVTACWSRVLAKLRELGTPGGLLADL